MKVITTSRERGREMTNRCIDDTEAYPFLFVPFSDVTHLQIGGLKLLGIGSINMIKAFNASLRCLITPSFP